MCVKILNLASKNHFEVQIMFFELCISSVKSLLTANQPQVKLNDSLTVGAKLKVSTMSSITCEQWINSYSSRVSLQVEDDKQFAKLPSQVQRSLNQFSNLVWLFLNQFIRYLVMLSSFLALVSLTSILYHLSSVP